MKTGTLALTSHNTDYNGNFTFCFCEMQGCKAKLFKVFVSASGLLSTRNTKGKPSAGAVHQATAEARRLAKEGANS